MAINPNFTIAVLLGWVEDDLNSEMQVRLALFHVDVFFAAVTRVAEEADDLAGGDLVAFFKVGCEGSVFAEVGVVVVPQGVVTADANSPAAVPVPAEFCDCAAFDGDDGGSDAAEQVVAEVAAFEAVAAGNSEVVIATVPESFGDWVEAGEFAGFKVDDAAEDCSETVEVVFVIFVVAVLVEDSRVFDGGV